MEYFIKALSNDVPVVKSLPSSMRRAPKVLKQFKSWSNAKYYEEEIGRLWHNYKVQSYRGQVFLPIFSNILSFRDSENQKPNWLS